MFSHLERPAVDMTSFNIVPEPPYEQYKIGRVHVCNRGHRRNISLYSKENKLGTTYARYLFQINYWKKFGRMIPNGMEVDHINENKLDDRLDNYQLLTGFENRMKSAARIPEKLVIGICPICKTYFSRTVSATQLHYHADRKVCCCSVTCSNIFRLYTLPPEISTLLSQMQFVYRIDAYNNAPEPWWEIVSWISKDILEFDITQYENRTKSRVESIRKYLDMGYTYEKIEELCGHNVEYLIYTHLPEYTQKSIVTKNIKCIRENLENGKSIKEIALQVNMEEATISQYITKYYPQYSKQSRMQKKAELIRPYLDGYLSYKQISEETGIPITNMPWLIRTYLPEYKVETIQERRLKKIKNCIEKELSWNDTANELGITPSQLKSIMYNGILDIPKKTNTVE